MDPLLRSRSSLHSNVFNIPHRSNVKIWPYVHYGGKQIYKPGSWVKYFEQATHVLPCNLEIFLVISCICYHCADKEVLQCTELVALWVGSDIIGPLCSVFFLPLVYWPGQSVFENLLFLPAFATVASSRSLHGVSKEQIAANRHRSMLMLT